MAVQDARDGLGSSDAFVPSHPDHIPRLLSLACLLALI